MLAVADSAYPSALERRATAAVQGIPPSRVHIFCASCAERFFGGYARWLAEETLVFEPAKSLPPPEFVRQAIDFCWHGDSTTTADELRRALIQMLPGQDEQPIFKTRLNNYFDMAEWLVNLGLSSVLDPQVSFGLKASAASLDFHFQLLNRRREIAGERANTETEFREFANDPGALAESAIQIEDATELRGERPDWQAMKKRSAAHGQQVLDQVLELLPQ